MWRGGCEEVGMGVVMRNCGLGEVGVGRWVWGGGCVGGGCGCGRWM